MQGWGWKSVHHPDHVDRVVERIQHSFDTGTPWEDTFPLRGADGNFRWFLSRANPLKDDRGNVLLWCGTNTDVTEQLAASELIKLLMNEVNHRARNMLATIQAIVNRTVAARDADLAASLSRRIAALAENQNLLNDTDWAGAHVRDIVSSQVAHVSDAEERRVVLAGPERLMLRPAAAETLGLAIHELATNAAKYGALTVDGGRVDVRWDVERNGGDSRFRIEWRESGGPPVEPPEQTGFGTIIIERNPVAAMEAEVTVDFAPGGLVWTMTADAERVLGDADSGFSLS